jgi:hypothetical protein
MGTISIIYGVAAAMIVMAMLYGAGLRAGRTSQLV